jgi:ComF family protein
MLGMSLDTHALPPSSLRARLGQLSRSCSALVSAIGHLALDAALPTLCAACRAPVAGQGLCASCWTKVSFIAPPYCEKLGIPFTHDGGEGQLSLQAITDPPSYDRARAAVRYDDVARQLVHALKYHDRTDLAPTMGRWMTRAGRVLLDDADVIVPVPLHWRRGWSRRYNQAGALGRMISEASGVPVNHAALIRNRPTAQQVGLTRTERTTNLAGAFEVPKSRRTVIEGRRIVLIDDVLTTGATAEACTKALLRAGAACVDVLTFARVVDARAAPI